MNNPSTGAPTGEDLDGVTAWIADLYQQVLSVDDVQTEDDFFVLGGTSISAMELLGIIGDASGHEVPVKRFYQATTVGDFARTVQSLIIDHRGGN